MMKKVLFVNSSLDGGGSEKVMTILANQMAKDGYEVTMVLCIHGEEVYHLDRNIKSIYLPENNENGIKMRITRLKELRKVIRNEKPEVIISFMSQINIYTILSSIGVCRNVIVSERADPKQRSKILRFAEEVLYTLFANHVVFQTQMVRGYYNRLIRRKSSVIFNPVDSNNLCVYKGVRQKAIAGIGRLTNQKNFHLLINSFYEFSREVEGYSLHIFGDGPLEEELHALTRELGIQNDVFFHGYVDNVSEQIRDYRMYVSSSNFEGISNAMLEAMILGIPSICTNCPVGGAQAVIEDGVNGILIPMNNKKALSDAMKLVARDDVFARKLSLESVKIAQMFDVKKITGEWEKLL